MLEEDFAGPQSALGGLGEVNGSFNRRLSFRARSPMPRLQRALKAHQLTQEGVVAPMGIVAVFTAQQGVELMVGIQRLFIRGGDSHTAPAQLGTADFNQTGFNARTVMREVVEPLADQMIGGQTVQNRGRSCVVGDRTRAW